MLGNGNLIEFVCLTHAEPNPTGPKIGLVEERWAYCAGHGSEPHEWSSIEPTPRERIAEAIQVGAVKRAS